MNLSMGKNDTSSASEFEENLSIIRGISFFSGLPLETLKVLAYLGTHERFPAGDYLFRQGDDDGQSFYIISGAARLRYEAGERQVELRDIAGGAFLGSLSLLGPARRLFSLQAMTEVTCLILTREKFTKALEQFPGMAPCILEALVNGIHSWEQHVLSHVGEDCPYCRQSVGVSLL
jgi:CRP/FNR family cyclic AMP-dependent transcriptional regulator